MPLDIDLLRRANPGADVTSGRQFCRSELERFRKKTGHSIDARVDVTVRQTLFSLAVTTTTAIGTAMVLGLGAYHAIQGSITAGDLLVVLAYIAAVYKPLETISYTAGALQDNLVGLRMAFHILDTEPVVPHRPAITRRGAATTYAVPVDDFCLVRVEGGAASTPAAARIVLSLDGAEVTTGVGVEHLAPGQALFVPLSDGVAEVHSPGVTFVAMPGLSPDGDVRADR